MNEFTNLNTQAELPGTLVDERATQQSDADFTPTDESDDEFLLDGSGVPVFSSDDLALLESDCELPTLFNRALKSLIELANEWPHLATSNPIYGRFTLGSGFESAVAVRAAFRLSRAALDFLEEDFKACEAQNIEFLETELAKFRAQGEAA